MIGRRAPSLTRLELIQATALAAAALATLPLIWPVLVRATSNWSAEEDLHFGFLVPPVCLGLAWWQRSALTRAARTSGGSWGGFFLVVITLLGYVLAERIGAHAPAAVAAGLLVWAELVCLFGWPVGRVLAFPWALLTFGISLQQTLLAPLAFQLQNITADGAGFASRLVGLPVQQDGVFLRGGAYSFVVTEACSGMNSLLALLALAAVWTYLAQIDATRRTALLITVLPLVVAANTTRVISVLVTAEYFGQDAAMGFFHGASSLLLFGLAVGGLLLTSRVLGCRGLGAV